MVEKDFPVAAILPLCTGNDRYSTLERMKITEEALKEFEALWRQDHPNEEISKAQLLEMATRVMRAVELVYRPIPPEKVGRFLQIQKQTRQKPRDRK